MPEPLIRRASDADVPAMAAVVNGWVDATGWMPRVHAPDVLEGHLRDALPTREIWVAGEPVEAYLSLDPVEGKIGGFYCARTGQGLGKALMDRAKEGRDRLYLHTHEANAGARRFYAREGFVETARLPAEPPENLPEIRMEWTR
ncbi:GNAT family N-acetyltransferase [Cereibacter sphaeroides]|nr:GNAT family N-acetyltransferase [Cereibacter sphaeroides]